MRLLINALAKYIFGLLLVGLLLFLPAGTLNYRGGWLFIGLLFIPMLVMGAVLLVKTPDLLAKRLRVREKETAQKGVVAAAALIFIGAFVLAGLDYRYGWTDVPPWLTWAAAVIMLLAYGMYAEVMRENA